jgi:hypothetical protein
MIPDLTVSDPEIAARHFARSESDEINASLR